MARSAATVTVVSVLSVVAVLGASACGRPADPVAVDANLDGRAVLASADKTVSANTGKVHVTMTTDVSGVPAGSATATGSTSPANRSMSFTLTGDGAYDRAAGLSSMTVDTGSMVEQLLSALPTAERDKIARAGGMPASWRQEVVQQGTVAYVRSGALSSLDPTLAGRWLRLDLARLPGAPSAASSFGGVSGLGGTGDPSAYLDYLKGAGADVTTVGPEQVNGVDTTHLRATLSMRQALEASGADRQKLERSLGQLPGNAASAFEDLTLPVDVYVDGQGYVRRIQMTYDVRGLIQALGSSAAGTGSTKGTVPADAGMTMAMTVDYSDLGAPVDIAVPPPDQTIDVCQALTSIGSRSKTTGTMPAGLC